MNTSPFHTSRPLQAQKSPNSTCTIMTPCRRARNPHNRQENLRDKREEDIRTRRKNSSGKGIKASAMQGDIILNAEKTKELVGLHAHDRIPGPNQAGPPLLMNSAPRNQSTSIKQNRELRWGSVCQAVCASHLSSRLASQPRTPHAPMPILLPILIPSCRCRCRSRCRCLRRRFPAPNPV